jgi:hypothetical protein
MHKGETSKNLDQILNLEKALKARKLSSKNLNIGFQGSGDKKDDELESSVACSKLSKKLVQ